MLPQLSGAVRVFLCTRPTDMRKGFDGISGLVQDCFSQDLLTGHLFLFLNRRRDRIKILYFDRDGLVIWYKRLEVGVFKLPRVAPGAGSVELRASELAMLLDGIDMAKLKRVPRYERPAQSGVRRAEKGVA